MYNLKEDLKKNPSKLIVTIILGIISIAFLIPLIWMLSTSAKFESDVMVFPIEWIPTRWNFVENFKAVWMSKVPFTTFYFNSIKLATITTLVTIIVSSMAAYSFSKLRFPGKSVLFGLLMAFLMIPEQATLVPRYIMIKWFGLFNTHEGLILMAMFSIYFTFLMRQYMVGISDEYIEAAKIDGAGYFKIYWKIMLPLCRPILATVGIIKFIWVWNDYQNPLIFLYDEKLYPITLGMQYFKTEYSENYAVMMMAALSAILPLIIVFIILQRNVIAGISLGGVKG
ncbi:carbohydrate ABC transporter permease [Bacillus sp. OK048]|uniref:carbohydrate ABC transporter permease n=1 Tax=Bacillus sp. OK048 TaxID=1882761 RepID=UPI00088E8B70|nr:carbohydrate ABC transporter permease [Bacillus sp. OK048]SDN23446.1 carbohydrate ABC transporter membrane protein 2, CUT1 family [Bacillus sp. OK048]